ncbi:hypothetical protein A2120_00860 [Candidatus Giovannonibacteria bacterium GWA2_45_15]|nr:MAG: hypothetical protein A2120_00860 [Candidatus Giovannonibacteria bacterium GWA2_45_15]
MNIFQESTERIRLAGALGNINQALIDELCKGGEVIELKFQAFTRKGKETFDGARVHQINSYQEGTPHPFKGGIRYTKYKTWQEMIDTTRTLATDMCLKIALTGLPFGPAKGTLNIDPDEYVQWELESITRGLTVEMLRKNILGADTDVPGPDYKTNAETMKWIYLEYGRLNTFMHHPNAAAVVTGKPVDFDGCPGRENATARGGLIVLNELVKSLKNPRVGVQGYGNVGKNICELLSDPNNDLLNGTILAVSDKASGLYNSKGMDFKLLDAYYKTHQTFKGCALGKEIAPKKITSAVEYDVFFTAAKENLITKHNAGALKTGVLAEVGNSAVTKEADEILEANKVMVIPDILANPGGVIVSFFEWRKNRGNILHTVDFNEELNRVHKELRDILEGSTKEVLKVQQQLKTTLRMASCVYALKELEKTIQKRNA